jgi:putative hydrolase of the HAD superfamily
VTEILPTDGARRPAGRAAAAAARRLAQPQAVRAVFCDVGFTLLAPHPSVTEIAARVCAERGLAVERACLQRALPAAETRLREGVRAAPDTWANERAIAAIWTGYFTELLRPCLAGMPADALAQTVEAVRRAFDHHTSYALFADVVPVLRTLHGRGLTLGVISDWGVALGSILNEHGLNRYFDFAVVSAATRHAKPHPRLFELALERAGAIADYAVHVGDSYTQDVLGARSVGIAPVLIDRAGRVDTARVDVPVVRDLYGLLDLLEVEPDGIDDLGGG